MSRNIDVNDRAEDDVEEECPCCRFMKEEFGMVEAAPIDELLRKGIEIPDPATLNDEAVSSALWRLIEALAELRIFVESTDHLSDRQLYEGLRNEVTQVMMYSPTDELSACHIDFVGSGSNEEIDSWLRFYADKRERRDWIKQFPDTVLPPHESLPYHRDALLPKRSQILPLM